MATPAQPLYALYDSLGGGVAVGGAGSGAELFQFSSPTLLAAQQIAQVFASAMNRAVLLVPIAGAPPYTQYLPQLSALGFATATGFATGCSATVLTAAGATFPIAAVATTTTPPTQGLLGCIVCVGPNNAGAGAVAWGIVTANTATTITVAQWTNPGSATGAAASTPNATSSYQVFTVPAPAAAGLNGISF